MIPTHRRLATLRVVALLRRVALLVTALRRVTAVAEPKTQVSKCASQLAANQSIQSLETRSFPSSRYGPILPIVEGPTKSPDDRARNRSRYRTGQTYA
jgi:hypothetical protein